MEVKVVREKAIASHLTGGGYAVTSSQVFIDENLPLPEQRELVIHEIVEAFLPFLCHDKVEELTELLTNGLDQLENKGNEGTYDYLDKG